MCFSDSPPRRHHGGGGARTGPRWPWSSSQAFVLTSCLLISRCVSFPSFLCPRRLGRLVTHLQRARRAFLVLRLSRSRAVVFAGRGEERSRDRLKGKRGRAHREAPWLSSGPRLPRQGRGISARRARGTNLLRHNRSVHKQTPLDGRAATLKELSL